MLKNVILSAASSFFFTLTSEVTSIESKDITYEWLTQDRTDSNYTDHIPHWRRLFNTMHVRTFLECGCGYSTKYFLDNADKVISIEYINPGYGDAFYQNCLRIFADSKNWIPMLYNSDCRSNSFNNACAYQCSMHKDYALIDSSYLKELDKHYKQLIAEAKKDGCDIDVAFVDPGVYIRGDMVKVLLANKIPIVAAHDTCTDNGTKEIENLYGWNKVVTPLEYIKIYIPFGKGTTFWVSKKLSTVIAALISYRDGIIQLSEEHSDITFQDLTTLADTP